jgi:hypothetical protein
MTTINIHASCVAMGRQGVLLLGKSGAGKSDLALRLIDAGAKLVADDRCDLRDVNGALVASAPANLAGLIEVRGLGIIAMPFRKRISLALAVRLGETPPRLPEQAFFRPPPALRGTRPVPMIVLDGFAASAPARIALALRAFSQGLFRDNCNNP